MTSVTINDITFTQVSTPISVTSLSSSNSTSYYGSLGINVFEIPSATTLTLVSISLSFLRLINKLIVE